MLVRVTYAMWVVLCMSYNDYLDTHEHGIVSGYAGYCLLMKVNYEF